MPRSSRHKSHKHSKHSSRDYSESEEEVIKSEKRSTDGNSAKAHRDSASGEKRKGSSQVREGKDRDLGGHGNGEVLEEYVSSKRRKEKLNVIGDDRWCGDDESDGEKEMHKVGSMRGARKLKEYSNKSEDVETDRNSKSKRYESVISGEGKEDSTVAAKEEGKGEGESKRRSERDSSTRREVRELKEKDHRSDKEKNGGWEDKGGDSELKLMDTGGKKQVAQAGDMIMERQGKRARENTDQTLQDELQNPELEKEVEKKMCRKREGSSERDRHHVDSKEGNERRLSSRGDRAKDVKYRDNKHKDLSYADKYQEDCYKDERRRDEKHRDEADKDNKKYLDVKYREDGEKDARRRSERHRQDAERDNKRKDEKHCEDRERDSMRKDDKYWEGTEREGRQDDKYYEDVDRDKRHKDGRYVDKDIKCGDESYLEDENPDDRHKDINYRDDSNRNNRHKEEKYQKDIERHKVSKEGDGHDKEKRPRDSKYRDELTSRDRAGHRSDSKRSRDDDYAADHHSRKSSAYDDSPTHDDRTTRYRDDQRRRRADEKEDFGDIRSQPMKDRRSDAEKRSAGGERTDPATDRDRIRSTPRTADMELTSSHSRRRSSPPSSAHAPRDNHRVVKHDEPMYRDYNHDERSRHNTSSRDSVGIVGGSDKTSYRLLDKLGQKDASLQEMSAERHVKSDICASPFEHVDKSPPSSTDRKQFSRTDVRRGIDMEELTQRGGGSRDWKEYSAKEGRGCQEAAVDVLPGEELQVDADTLSVSSPYMRNNHVSNSSKSVQPPPVRTGVDSSLPLGSAEDDGRGKSNIRHRRTGDPNIGRVQGNSWRGTPSWPSPVANGFLPFPPPVGFHSVMHTFPAPPMFGVRPSMDLDHPSPYHMPDADRFSGPGYPIGWRPQIESSGRPLHAWDASNAVFGEGSNFYGRSDWDHAGNVSGGRGWEMSEDLLRGPNRGASMEMPYSNKENGLVESGDAALAGQSLQPVQIEQSRADQQAESTHLSHSAETVEKNEAEDPLNSLEYSSDVKMSKKNYIRLCHVYFSKLDISADLAEPELYNECIGLFGVDQNMYSNVDDSKVLCAEDEEAKMSSHKLLSCTLFASTDDSVFQKSLSLYQKQKVNFTAQGSDKLYSLINFIPTSDQEDQKVDDVKSENLHPEDNMLVAEDTLQNFDIYVDSKSSLQKDDTAAISDELVSASDVNMLKSALDMEQQEHDMEEKPLPAGSTELWEALLPSNAESEAMESECKNEDVMLVDRSKGVSLLSSDIPTGASEAMMPVSVVSELVNFRRIHHSPENTH